MIEIRLTNVQARIGNMDDGTKIIGFADESSGIVVTVVMPSLGFDDFATALNKAKINVPAVETATVLPFTRPEGS